MIVGIDMGGTNIDGVIIQDGQIINIIKKPIDRDDLYASVWGAISSLLKDYNLQEIKRVNLSTTVSTNALAEGKLTKVGLILPPGPGISPQLYLGEDMTRFLISGYTDHRGVVVEDFNESDLEKAIIFFKENAIEDCALVTKFSNRNPSTELALEKILAPHFAHLTLGHSLGGNLNFPRRVHTAYLNAATRETFQNFLFRIVKSLKELGVQAPIFILKADGGTMDIESAQKKPVESLLSGPAASLMGLKALLDDREDTLLLDIGGTTTDIFFLANGDSLFAPQGIKIAEFKTLVRAIYSSSLALGGDSTIKVEGARLVIGPERRGAPCVFGGGKPTPTDALVALDLLKLGAKEKEKALGSMKILAQQMASSPLEVAQKIVDNFILTIKEEVTRLLLEINNQPVYTIKEILTNKKIKPKSISVIGGIANVLAPLLGERFALTARYPENYEVANALGAALARPTLELNLIANTHLQTLAVPELAIYESLEKNFKLSQARQLVIELGEKLALSRGAQKEDVEIEIVEEQSFNMVRGFNQLGKNIRLKAQIKPGLIKN